MSEQAPFYVEGVPHFWRRDGQDWILTQGSRIVGRVSPDGGTVLFRFQQADGAWSDIASLTRAKDAAVGFLGRIDAMAPERFSTPQNQALKKRPFPAGASNGIPGTGIAA